jgi:hypothetical protein
MRNQETSSTQPGELTLAQANEDRYPKLTRVLQRIAGEADLPTGAIERLEVTCLANGDATYRVWPARAEEPVGGFLPQGD